MTQLHGFELIREAYLGELSSTVRHYRHSKTGAELISVENADDNKSFGVAFQTPSPDDTGLPHILEHSVLAGSRKYPLKEPFVELIKTSLNTFVNAMTFPDMTIYPVASTNVKDFYNLIDVYMDAVFYPLITEKVFQQEGWHYETSDANHPLIYKGVVFNEMKGYFSTPEIVMQDEVKTYLLPDTPYANNSGGNPAVIPNLTYAQFKTYHETYYHPSNARFFFYGDDNPEERLRLVNDFIAEFERKHIDSTIPLQPRWQEPRKATLAVDAGDATADSKKGLMTMNWLLTEVTNNQDMMALGILNHILIGTPGSPLFVALMESGFGEDLAGGGLDTYAREASYSIGMKGIVAADSEKIENLILDTLGALADDGIDPDTIQASLNTIEFELREKNTGRFPRGLAAFITMLPVWLHGGDPIDAMAFEDDLQAVKQAYAQNPQLFETLIGKYFLQNPHRVTITMQPDPTVKEKREADEKQRLQEARANMNADDIAHIIKDVEILKAMQEAPDKPEDLAKLPTLTLADLERKIKTIPSETLTLADTTVLYHDLGTSGVAYLDLAFNLKTLPTQYVPFVSLFGKALTEMGTATQDFIQLQNRIGAKTGGIGVTEFASLTLNRQDSAIYLVLRAKAMTDQTAEMLDILKDILLTVNFDDQDRFLQMVLEDKAQFEAYLGLIGHQIDNTRLRAKFDTVGWFNEQNSGVSQLLFLRELANTVQHDWASVLNTLNDMRQLLMNRHSLIANITLDKEPWQAFAPQLEAFLGALPHQTSSLHTWQPSQMPAHEGFAVPTQVNFVGKGANLYDLGYTLSGSHNVILKHFNLTYLWTKIRVQGGAYGGTFNFNPISGVGTFLSWQDPNLVETLNNYDGSAEFLRTFEMTQEELEKAIIGAIGQVDAYLLPDAKGYVSLMNHLIGNSDELRQQRRDEIFATTLQDFRNFADVMQQVAHHGVVVVTGAPNKLQEANEQLTQKLTIVDLQ
jgi:Zn-dependent M16 (insulinase) family peptidase